MGQFAYGAAYVHPESLDNIEISMKGSTPVWDPSLVNFCKGVIKAVRVVQRKLGGNYEIKFLGIDQHLILHPPQLVEAHVMWQYNLYGVEVNCSVGRLCYKHDDASVLLVGGIYTPEELGKQYSDTEAAGRELLRLFHLAWREKYGPSDALRAIEEKIITSSQD